MRKKPKRFLRVRRFLYYFLSTLLFLGLLGGLKAFTMKNDYLISSETDMFVLNYVERIYNIDVADETLLDERKEYVSNATMNYKESLHDNITISKLTNKEIKTKQVLEEKNNYRLYEYVLVLDYAYRTIEQDTTTQMQFAEKIVLIQDIETEGYLVISNTPYDYEIPIGIEQETKKTFDEETKKKNKIEGQPVEEKQKDEYIEQLSVFFETYSTNITSAKSLVSSDVFLAELTGSFDIENLKINDIKENQEKIKMIVTIPYTVDEILTFEKSYLITMENKTIIQMEEI